jgi:hypothetical protein
VIEPSVLSALKADGSIATWGDPDFGGAGAPSGSGYTKIYSTYGAFAALKIDGSITACTYTSSMRITPRRDCSISFNGGQGTIS